MSAVSPLAHVIAGPQLRTVANLDGRKVVVVEPLRYIPVAEQPAATWMSAASRVADFLRRQTGWVSANEIALMLAMNPKTVKVHVSDLRKRGIPIESGAWGTSTYRLREART